MVVQISFSGFVSFRYIPRSRITWSYHSFSFIYFLRNLYFSIVAAPVYIPTSKCAGVSFFSTSWPILVMYYLFFFIVAIITLWGDTSWFMFAFPWMLSIFSHSCLPSVCHLCKNVYSDSLPIFNWIVFVLLLLLSCMISLYILDINLLSDMICSILSHSVGSLVFCWWFSLFCERFSVWSSPTCLFLL